MSIANEEEILLLEEFRENVKDILTEEQADDNLFLLRWLRARDFNLDQAEEMLRNAIDWRNENGLDKKGQTPQKKEPYFQKNYPYWVDGIDRKGRPVHTCPFGKWDARKAIKDGKVEQLVSYFIEGFEESLRAIRRANEMRIKAGGEEEPITQLISICDMSNFPYFQMFNYQCIQTLLKIAQYNESYYPEILHTLYFINCPCTSITNTLLSFGSTVASSKTMAKLKLFGTDKEEWQKEILKIVSPEQIRPMFGGTKTNDFNPFL